MDFFDKLGQKFSETYNTASEKTSKLARETKLKMLISETKDTQKQLFEKLGQEFYKKYLNKRDSDVAIEFIENFKEIDKTNLQIKDYENEILTLKGLRPCPKCGKSNYTDIRQFNLMFETNRGVTKDSLSKIYLRPETAQGEFVNFLNVYRTMRPKIPFGIGQIGKAFRNEITPGNFTFRPIEFDQMEHQFFCK